MRQGLSAHAAAPAPAQPAQAPVKQQQPQAESHRWQPQPQQQQRLPSPAPALTQQPQAAPQEPPIVPQQQQLLPVMSQPQAVQPSQQQRDATPPAEPQHRATPPPAKVSTQPLLTDQIGRVLQTSAAEFALNRAFMLCVPHMQLVPCEDMPYEQLHHRQTRIGTWLKSYHLTNVAEMHATCVILMPGLHCCRPV